MLILRIDEWAKFNLWCQQKGETVDQFVTVLHTMAEHCSYGAIKEKMICHRLSVGVRNASLSLKLRFDSSLENSGYSSKSKWDGEKQQSIVRPADQPPNIDYVISKKQLRHVLDVGGHHHIPAMVVPFEKPSATNVLRRAIIL